MIIIDFLVGLAILLLIVTLVAFVISARMMLPLSDWLNVLSRRVGLAGPWRGSRTVGIHGLGTISGEFTVRAGEEIGSGWVYVKGELWHAVCPSRLAPTLRDGDTAEIVYNDDLTVTVVRKPPHTVEIHGPPEDPGADSGERAH